MNGPGRRHGFGCPRCQLEGCVLGLVTGMAVGYGFTLLAGLGKTSGAQD